MIYFIRNGEFVKIGRAAYPEQRLAQLQIGNPTPLELLATVPGGRGEEYVLHKHFAAFGVGGEWFKDCDEIRAFINAPWPIEVPENKRPHPPLTAADFAAILSSTLALAAEAGLMIGVRNAAANEKRPDGLMIYIAGLHTDGNGAILAVEVVQEVQS
jgi:hypothetical protein